MRITMKKVVTQLELTNQRIRIFNEECHTNIPEITLYAPNGNYYLHQKVHNSALGNIVGAGSAHTAREAYGTLVGIWQTLMTIQRTMP